MLLFTACWHDKQQQPISTAAQVITTQIVSESPLYPEVKKAIDLIQMRFAPDKRTELFLMETVQLNDSLLVSVEVGQSAAKQALDSLAATLTVPVRLHTTLLPDASVGNQHKAVVNVSVCNIRTRPEHPAELATQALMGMPLQVWKKKGNWYLVQTPDRYLGWVDGSSIKLMNASAFDRWQAQPKAIFTPIFGMAYAKPDATSATIADLVAGCIVIMRQPRNGFTWIGFPDGREAYVPAQQLQSLDKWMETTQPTPANLVSTARSMLGIPYLWGGTSVKGMDCSGFTKTVYWLNGLIIPRDASQQVWAGKEIDSKRDFGKLQPGDLLFFGKAATDSTPEKVVHVGMWIGNGEFIHASGMIRISSMNPQAPNFDRYEYTRYLRAKRLLNVSSDKYLIAPTQVFSKTSSLSQR
ncbi:MAG: C40 family peptidase [Cytophagales bacterium]|nr:C40 family peptidase [Bernardetiaceae bacterium]MDW8206148.1 C40 family peptidase [Cytophagales bacterium]